MKAFALVLSSACLLVGASACGGGGAEPTAADASASLIEQVDDVCVEWRQALDVRGDFPVQGFQPEHPSAAELSVVGEYFALANTADAEALASLRGLDAPAASQPELKALTAAIEVQLANAQLQVVAARKGDVPGFTATLRPAAAATASVNAAAEVLGAQQCAF